MRKLIIDGKDMREPAEVKAPKKEAPNVKAVKPANKARKAATK